MAKSHVERLRDGERNTRFFQISVLMERNSNGILSLNDNVGNRLPGPIDIRNHISDFFFHNIYTTSHHSSNAHRTTNLCTHQLNVLPSDKEIRTSLFSMHPNKAPGP